MGEVATRLMAIAELLGSLVISIFYILEALVMLFIPTSLKRKDIKGNVVLITGGGSGIGRLMCLKFAKFGAKIVTWDVNTPANEETARMVREAGGECHAQTVDLCNRDAIYVAADIIKKDIGKVDILVNNAGIVTGKSFLDSPDDSIQRTFDVNTMAHFWLAKAFLPEMLSADKGHIVTVASLAGMVGVNKLTDYCASKFAAVGFDETLRTELMVEGRKGVHTTLVCPYYIDTGMFDGVSSRLMPILKPEFVANSIVDGTLCNEYVIILPWYSRFLVLLKLLLPQKAIYLCGRVIGVNCSMDEFRGRKKVN
ncbi:epidermal retinol dehydrogenase 2-like [Oratosquilla oratoria]|uniref:epidermal retinol dehydrogenase 2-like n=1 Tax=Oratosquilla oratoria TaxID=337810 RepID=UPI003F7685B6